MDYRWDDIRIFLALYRARTLSGGAAALKVDGSTTSRRLAAFEQTLGKTLFERTRDGLAPTPAADDLYPFAESMEAAGRRFEEAADELDGAVEGLVRITCPPTFAEVFLVPLLPELVAAQPGLRFEIDPSQRRLDLARGEADLAVRDAPAATGDVVVTRLASLRSAILASPSRADVPLARLDDVPWITWSDPVSHLPSARWLESHAPSAPRLLRTSSYAAQLAAAAAGLGYVIGPTIFQRTHALVEVEVSDDVRARLEELAHEELWLAAARSRRTLPRIAYVWDALVAKSAELL